MTYTKEYILEQQTIGAACLNRISEYMANEYVLLTVPLTKIKVDSCQYPHINLDNWEELYGYGNNSLDIITKLITRYKQGLEVFPIILDSSMELLDGLHRYVAAYTLNKPTIEAYFPLGNKV